MTSTISTPSVQDGNEFLLDVQGLQAEFRTGGSRWVPVTHDVSLSVRRGEVLGVVGESGSGKSVSMASVLGLMPYQGGRVAQGRALFDGRDLLTLKERELRQIRGSKIGMIFQDPMTSLNPVRAVQRQMVETLRAHTALTAAEAKERALELLRLVRIPDAARRLRAYPHELSGGMRQRVMIAIALSCEPELIIADEPTTALDVTVQADVLALLRQRTRERGVSVVIISHDVGVIASLADRIAVMYAGRVVESGSAREVLGHPQHPYTLGLLESIPGVHGPRTERLPSIPGLPPRPGGDQKGCSFRERCRFAVSRCATERPALAKVADEPQHRAACHFAISEDGRAVLREDVVGDE